jgi:hypothetical protein
MVQSSLSDLGNHFVSSLAHSAGMAVAGGFGGGMWGAGLGALAGQVTGGTASALWRALQASRARGAMANALDVVGEGFPAPAGANVLRPPPPLLPPGAAAPLTSALASPFATYAGQ